MEETGYRILYRILRLIALRQTNLTMPGFIGYRELSEQFERQPGGYWVDPHHGWDEPLAELNRRCFGLFDATVRPALSVLVVHQDGDRRPGGGFWNIRMPDGRVVTPARRSEEAWIAICNDVYRTQWPPELTDLPTA